MMHQYGAHLDESVRNAGVFFIFEFNVQNAYWDNIFYAVFIIRQLRRNIAILLSIRTRRRIYY